MQPNRVGTRPISVCPDQLLRSQQFVYPAPLLQDELHVSNTPLGTLLAAFFSVHALLQMTAGWLVDRFDVKWVFASGLFLWSSATAVTGVLHGFRALIAARIILGVGESATFPSFSKILSAYFSEANVVFPMPC